MSCIDKKLIRNLWGNDKVDWVSASSGGLLCLWNTDVFERELCWGGGNALGVVGKWEEVRVVLVNIYGPSSTIERCNLWERLERKLVASEVELWCVCGDFNAIRRPVERKGSGVVRGKKDMEDFNKFITSTHLVDLPLNRRKYTWYKTNGSCCSRLDRFLVDRKSVV